MCTSCYSCKHKGPPPLLLPESDVLLGRCVPRSACSIAWMVGLNHVSVITITQQSWMFFCVDMVSSSSLALLESDLAFVMNRLGSEGLYGFLPRLACILAWEPRFCFVSWCCLRRFPAGSVVCSDSGGLTSSNKMSCLGSSRLNVQFMGIKPMLSSSCRLYFSYACAYVAVNR